MRNFEDFDRDFDRKVNRGFGFIIAAWVISALLSLGFLGVVIWAIIQLVGWVQTK